MKAQLRIAMAIGAALLLVGLAIVTSRPKPEPKYNGRPLSDWLTQLFANYPRMDRKAVQALNAMGEEAVRSLTATVDNEDSPLKIKLLEYSDKFPMLANVLPTKFWDRFVAIKALGEMGTNAVSAVPSLQKLTAADDYMLAPSARAALVLIENQPVEPLAIEYFETKGTNSAMAFGTLLQLGPHAKLAIPIVFGKLQSTNERVRLGAASLLQSIGMESTECVPVFTNLLTDSDRVMRTIGIGGLANCGDMATSAAPAIVELLDDPESLCRSSALIYLSRAIPPEAFHPFRTKVQQATRDADQNVRELAEHVLREKDSSK
jgi:hypothetical protein